MNGRSVSSLTTALILAGVVADGHAAGFALIEQNSSGIGNAFAGASAVAEDASAIWFNPAGLTQLNGHSVTVAAHLISPSIKFKDSGASVGSASATGDNGGNAGDMVVLPNVYASFSVGEKLRLGLGLNAPFGLLTEYGDNFIGRFQGVKSEIKTVNVNPTVAYRISDVVSVGGGLNYQRIEAELTARVTPLGGPAANALSILEADDTAVGFNVGALFKLGDDMRLGVSYRSGMSYTVEGTAKVYSTSGTLLSSRPITAEIDLPAIASLSIVQTYTPEWDLLGDVTWTKWSSIKSINIVTTGTPIPALNLQLKDSWRLSLGVNYRPNESWVVKGGFAWDQTPVQDEYRTVRLPDADRYWVSLGAKYHLSKMASVDLGYVHIFGGSAPIDQTLGNQTLYGHVVGDYDLSVDILSVQAAFAF